MAVYHLHVRLVRRSRGQDAVAKAAYNARSLLVNENTGRHFDYRYRGRAQYSEIIVPEGAPDWLRILAQNQQAFWSAIERVERRKDAQLAREVEISLPHELTARQREILVKEIVNEMFLKYGMVAHVSLHSPPCPERDSHNYHAHILLTLRQIEERGFGNKVREWNKKALFRKWRRELANFTNRHLERHGHKERVDDRTLKNQGIDREPTIYLGPVASYCERHGIENTRGKKLREIEKRNRLKEEAKIIDAILSQVRLDYKRQSENRLQRKSGQSPSNSDWPLQLNEHKREVALSHIMRDLQADKIPDAADFRHLSSADLDNIKKQGFDCLRNLFCQQERKRDRER